MATCPLDWGVCDEEFDRIQLKSASRLSSRAVRWAGVVAQDSCVAKVLLIAGGKGIALRSRSKCTSQRNGITTIFYICFFKKSSQIQSTHTLHRVCRTTFDFFRTLVYNQLARLSHYLRRVASDTIAQEGSIPGSASEAVEAAGQAEPEQVSQGGVP